MLAGHRSCWTERTGINGSRSNNLKDSGRMTEPVKDTTADVMCKTVTARLEQEQEPHMTVAGPELARDR